MLRIFFVVDFFFFWQIYITKTNRLVCDINAKENNVKWNVYSLFICLFSTKENTFVWIFKIFHDWAVYKSHNGGMMEPAWQLHAWKTDLLTSEGQNCGSPLISITVVRLATSLFPACAFNKLLYLHNCNSWHMTCKFRIPVSASIIHPV